MSDGFDKELVEALLRLRVAFKKYGLDGPVEIVLTDADMIAIKSMPNKDWLTDTRGGFTTTIAGFDVSAQRNDPTEREVIQSCIAQLHRMLR